MRFLEVPGADLGRGNLRGNGEHGHTRSVAVKEAIDKMQIARSAAAADREITRKMRPRTRGKGRDLLVPDMNPFDLFWRPLHKRLESFLSGTATTKSPAD
jgi:hypothetical protein